MRTPPGRLIGAALAAFVATVAAATPLTSGGRAFAHIDPDPPEAPAASTQSVGFTVEHGCDGSPTVQLDMRLPEGVSEVAAEPIDGWTSSITDNVLSFAGGTLPDDTAMTFRIVMTLPNTPGATLYFPFVQRCAVGEIRWIDLPAGDAEAEQPAPAMLLSAAVTPPPALPVAPATTLAAIPSTTTAATPPTSLAPTTEAAVETTGPPTTSAPSPATTTASSIPGRVANATATTTRSGSVVFFAVVAVLAGLGAFVILRVRRARSPIQ